MGKVVFICTDTIGRGDEALGRKLMASFLYSLARTEPRPEAVLLMNAGVRLACNASPVLDDLRLLVEDGVAVKACGTCLDYYGLKDALAVGEVGNMNDTAAAFMRANDVVTIA
ncbi:MAG: sulfurtransferase-like selenium metabolism protein YedF [Coriobacteriia bacterium]|nr:sulfurtransferase-like selenium metabolism protein YedF [Coriobacteriia bacterium]